MNEPHGIHRKLYDDSLVDRLARQTAFENLPQFAHKKNRRKEVSNVLRRAHVQHPGLSKGGWHGGKRSELPESQAGKGSTQC